MSDNVVLQADRLLPASRPIRRPARVDLVDKPCLVMYDLYVSDGHVFVGSYYMIVTLVNMLLERRADLPLC